MNKMPRKLNRRIREDQTLSGDEISMLHMLCKLCDDEGWVRGVYYKYVMEEIGISRSQFYRLVSSLEKKRYISPEKHDASDMDICLSDVYFFEVRPENHYKPVLLYTDYIDLNREIFGKEFYKYGGVAKRILYALADQVTVTDAIRYKYGGKATRKLFRVHTRMYQSFAREFNVTVRTIKKAFNELRDVVEVYYDAGYTGKDIVTLKASKLLKPCVTISEKGKHVQRKKTDDMDTNMHYIRTMCRRLGVNAEEQGIADSAALITQYRKKAEGLNIKIHSLIIRAIEAVGSFLNAAGINKYISNYIANGSLKRKDMLYTEI